MGSVTVITILNYMKPHLCYLGAFECANLVVNQGKKERKQRENSAVNLHQVQTCLSFADC